jgi:hypothetical protein
VILNSYFLSYSCAATLENGVIEFDTYDEAIEAFNAHEMSGYAVSLREFDFTGELAKEIRKGKGFTYVDRRVEFVG